MHGSRLGLGIGLSRLSAHTEPAVSRTLGRQEPGLVCVWGSRRRATLCAQKACQPHSAALSLELPPTSSPLPGPIFFLNFLFIALEEALRYGAPLPAVELDENSDLGRYATVLGAFPFDGRKDGSRKPSSSSTTAPSPEEDANSIVKRYGLRNPSSSSSLLFRTLLLLWAERRRRLPWDLRLPLLRRELETLWHSTSICTEVVNSISFRGTRFFFF